MDLNLTGKRALVTGGSRGIGRAIARQLALEGCHVVLVARDRNELAAAADDLASESGRTCVAIPADTADDTSVAEMASQATEALGGIDILVNAAARSAGGGGPAMKLQPATVREEFDLKALGYLRCVQQLAPQMIERGWGRIINVGGLAARQTGAVSAAIRNVAVAALTKNLADELGPHGITVTAVHPGVSRTERIARQIEQRAAADSKSAESVAAAMGASYAIGRIVEPSEIADIVAFLASPRSAAINGDAIACGGGKVGAIYY